MALGTFLGTLSWRWRKAGGGIRACIWPSDALNYWRGMQDPLIITKTANVRKGAIPISGSLGSKLGHCS